MKFLISSSFYTDFELVEAENKQDILDFINSEGLHDEKVQVIGSSDNLTLEEAQKQADETIFIEEYI